MVGWESKEECEKEKVGLCHPSSPRSHAVLVHYPRSQSKARVLRAIELCANAPNADGTHPFATTTVRGSRSWGVGLGPTRVA